jgi:hypothetical protein
MRFPMTAVAPALRAVGIGIFATQFVVAGLYSKTVFVKLVLPESVCPPMT